MATAKTGQGLQGAMELGKGLEALAIRHQVPLAAVDYPPAMGIRALEVLYSALRGQWVPKIVNVPSDIILTRGAATRSIRPQLLAEEHVRWDLPDDLVLASGGVDAELCGVGAAVLASRSTTTT